MLFLNFAFYKIWQKDFAAKCSFSFDEYQEGNIADMCRGVNVCIGNTSNDNKESMYCF